MMQQHPGADRASRWQRTKRVEKVVDSRRIGEKSLRQEFGAEPGGRSPPDLPAIRRQELFGRTAISKGGGKRLASQTSRFQGEGDTGPSQGPDKSRCLTRHQQSVGDKTPPPRPEIERP